MTDQNLNDTTDDTSNEDILNEEMLEQLDGSQDYPTFKSKDNIIKFFTKILSLKDSTKVSNLENLEIGKSKLALRSWQQLALFCDQCSLPTISTYFRNQGEIIASTSMGRKGFFLTTSVTQVRKDQKIHMPTVRNDPKFWQKKQQGDNIGQ